MTAPGVYSPDQLREHARRVARDEDDTAREVEVMARAMEEANGYPMEDGGWQEWIPEAEAARNALLAMREGE